MPRAKRSMYLEPRSLFSFPVFIPFLSSSFYPSSMFFLPSPLPPSHHGARTRFCDSLKNRPS